MLVNLLFFCLGFTSFTLSLNVENEKHHKKKAFLIWFEIPKKISVSKLEKKCYKKGIFEKDLAEIEIAYLVCDFSSSFFDR